jgi:hypothetical protein
MRPIHIEISAILTSEPAEICAKILDTEQWRTFTGYSILPGIAHASFEKQTAEIVGSRIRVKNTDGSTHVEEIIEWDVPHQICLRFQEFQPPLQNLAEQFIETWRFRPTPSGVEATRAMDLYPKNWIGWLLLLPISRLMKKAFLQNLQNLMNAER